MLEQMLVKLNKMLVYNQLIRTVFLIQVKLQHPEIYGVWAYMLTHPIDENFSMVIRFRQDEWVSKRQAQRRARKPGIRL